MIGGLSFLSPWWLVGVPLVAAGLVYIYRRRASRKSKVVSTLLLLKDFRKPSVERAKIELPLRFFLELCFLALLVCLLAGMRSESVSQRVALIVDDSLSTQALSSDGEMLYSKIRQDVSDYLSSLGADVSIDVYRTPGQRAIVEHEDASGAEDSLQSTASFLHPDQLAPLIEGVARKGYDEIHVFTDKDVQGEQKSKGLTVHSVAQAAKGRENIALERAMVSVSDKKVHLAVRSFSIRPAAVTVSIEGGDRQLLKLAPKASEELILSPPQNAEKISVQLTLQDGEDTLLLDNKAVIASVPKQSDIIKVVGDASDAALGLGGISSYAFRHIAPAEYVDDDSSTYIFHRFSPRTLPKTSALFILPGDSPLFKTKGLFDNLTVTRWDASHPVTTYLHLNLLNFAKAQTFVPHPWQQVVLSTEEGPILLAGETTGNRYLVSGVELFPFRGKESPLMSILTLNLLKWLRDGDKTRNSGDGFFYDESESDLRGNTLDVSHFEVSARVAPSEPRNPLRDIVILILLGLLAVDLMYLLSTRRLIGAKS